MWGIIVMYTMLINVLCCVGWCGEEWWNTGTQEFVSNLLLNTLVAYMGVGRKVGNSRKTSTQADKHLPELLLN